MIISTLYYFFQNFSFVMIRNLSLFRDVLLCIPMFRHFSCCVTCSLYCCDPFLIFNIIRKLFEICCYCLQRLVLIMMNYCVINNFVDLTQKQLKNREYAGLGTNILVKKSGSNNLIFLKK